MDRTALKVHTPMRSTALMARSRAVPVDSWRRHGRDGPGEGSIAGEFDLWASGTVRSPDFFVFSHTYMIYLWPICCMMLYVVSLPCNREVPLRP